MAHLVRLRQLRLLLRFTVATLFIRADCEAKKRASPAPTCAVRGRGRWEKISSDKQCRYSENRRRSRSCRSHTKRALKGGEEREIHFPLRRLAHQRGKPRNLYASLTGSSENTWQKPRYISGWLKAYNTIANPRTSFLNEKKQKQNTNSSSTPLGSTKLLYLAHLIICCLIPTT
jgi:hypothetical protein